jgi:formylglycine-generating enzyme required for sulfatase activity
MIRIQKKISMHLIEQIKEQVGHRGLEMPAKRILLALGVIPIFLVSQASCSLFRSNPISLPANITTPTAANASPVATPLVVSTKISPMDGMVMVKIPAGEFNMGKEDNVENADGPRHTVYLDDYWIDQTDVTNAMFAKCVQAGQCTYGIQHAATEIHFGNPEYADHPVVYVTWPQAVTYCQWAGRRLPSEAEWEKAARGTDERPFPWGKKPVDPTLANYDNNIGDTTPVGKYPLGASPYGLLDMAGNVRQWVADWFDALFYRNSPLQNPLGPGMGEKRVLRGGSFKDPANGVRVTVRFEHVPLSAGMNRGFRCASSQ